MICVENITKTYRHNITANKNISFEVHEGECFCLLGPNGAGKSTLIKQITTLFRPTTGSIHVCGIDVVNYPLKARMRMGIMPQECSLFEHVTVEQHTNIFTKLKHARISDSHEILQILDLDTRMRLNIGCLSLGQKRKLLLATALFGSPDVIVLDEPTTGLSPESRREVWNIIQKRKQNGTTILLTTHTLDEAEALSDKIGILNNGSLIYEGSLELLQTNRLDKYAVSYRNNGSVEEERFRNFRDASQFVEQQDLKKFSLSPVSLESIYFEIIGKR